MHRDARTIIFYPASVAAWTKPGPIMGPEDQKRYPEAFEHLWHVNDKRYRRYARMCPGRRAEKTRAIREAGCEALAERAAEVENPRDVEALAREIEGADEAVRREVQAIANTTLGNRREAVALEIYAEATGARIETPTDRYVLVLHESPDLLVQVNGRIDGLIAADSPGEARVLEVKTRTRRLTRRVSAAERLQLEFYLRMLRLQSGVLLEVHGRDWVAHDYAADDGLYERTKERLVGFARRFKAFLEDEGAKLAYVDASEAGRAQMVAHMVDPRMPGLATESQARRRGLQGS